jgi:hypothetical protein
LLYVDNINSPKDWLLFWDTSKLIASGKYELIYPGVTPNYHFLYPPFILFFLCPLGYLSKTGGYIAIIIFSITMILAAFYVMNSIFKLRRSDFLKYCIIILSSASWIIMLPLGHFSAYYLFIICAGLKLRIMEKPWLSGLLLSLLMIKPNIGIIFPFLFFIRREFKLVIGWSVGFGFLLLVSFIFFRVTWEHYISLTMNINSIILMIQPWKHHTLRAFLYSLSCLNSHECVFWIWFISCFILFGLCSYVWFSTKNVNIFYPRLFGIAILCIVVCNPYLYHYDAILLSLPVIVLLANKTHYYFSFTYILMGTLLFLTYFFQQISVLYLQRGLSVVSIPLILCLIIDCIDMIYFKLNEPIIPIDKESLSLTRLINLWFHDSFLHR